MARQQILTLVPWIGAGLLALGALQITLTLLRGEPTGLRVLGTGLLVGAGGLGLVARGTHGSRRLRFVSAGLALGIFAGWWAGG